MSFGALGKPASKERQGAKSREAGPRLGVERDGDLIVAPVMTVGAQLARGGLDWARSGVLRCAMGIWVAA